MALLEHGLAAGQYRTRLRETDDLSGVTRTALTHVHSPGVATGVAPARHRRTTRTIRRPQRLQRTVREKPRLICTRQNITRNYIF